MESEYIYVRLKRPEDYEDVSDDLTLSDFIDIEGIISNGWEIEMIDFIGLKAKCRAYEQALEYYRDANYYDGGYNLVDADTARSVLEKYRGCE